MKNIHILPTDKPSRLHYFKANKAGYYLYPNNELVVPKNPNCINQNIYITSDEEIKEGDWFYDLDTEYLRVKQSWENSHLGFNGKKIILTTDQDLIKDDVQAIDDEFLEWFVKNSSCEEVEIESKVIKDGVWTDLKGYVELPTIHSIIHKIIIPRTTQQIINEYYAGGLEMGQIIPKKEPKKIFDLPVATNLVYSVTEETLEEDCSCTDECLGYLTKSCKRIEESKQEWPESTGNILSDYAIGKSKAIQKSMHLDAKIAYRYMHKQETLEEAAVNCWAEGAWDNRDDFTEGFIEGAKWQQERMYSYEEVLEQLNLLYNMKNSLVDTFTDENDYITMKWFEQFKKK